MHKLASIKMRKFCAERIFWNECAQLGASIKTKSKGKKENGISENEHKTL